MSDRTGEESGTEPVGDSLRRGEKLPYRIELWSALDVGGAAGARVEHVLGRAASAALARAIFAAALTEHPGRRITLRRGASMLVDSAQSKDK